MHPLTSKGGAFVSKLYIRFGLDKKLQITVSISDGIYSALSVKSDTGHVEIPSDFAFRSMHVEVETGHVKSRARTLDFANIKTSTGGKCDISTSTGDIIITVG